jgi:hypothetical protein
LPGDIVYKITGEVMRLNGGKMELRGGALMGVLVITMLSALACGGDEETEKDMSSGVDMTQGQDMSTLPEDMPVTPEDMPITPEDMPVTPDDMPVTPEDMPDEPDMPADMMVEPDMPASTAGWTKMSQPCTGTKTDAFWFDDKNTGFAGCGTNGSGQGLFKTTDGGVTWTSQRNFMGVRVDDVRRAPDGKLYGSGLDSVDGFQVFQIDDAVPTNLKKVGLYKRSNNAFTSVGQGENIAVTADGQMFVDSLTGTQSAYRAAGAADFTELGTFLEEGLADPDAGGRQMSQVVAFNNRFWAVGSRISEPGVVFVPSTLPGATYHMKAVDLQPSTRDGEMHDLHVWSETSAIVVGFDQSTRYPFISRLDGDASDAANWTAIDLADFNIDFQGGLWNLHVQGERVVVVGQAFPSNDGFALLSEDRGLTWTDITPLDQNQKRASTQMTNVWMFEDGVILAAAEGGQMWRYQP